LELSQLYTRCFTHGGAKNKWSRFSIGHPKASISNGVIKDKAPSFKETPLLLAVATP